MKKPAHPISCCRKCRNAELHQRPLNPVIARCLKRKGERFPASVVMRCEYYRQRETPENIIMHGYYDIIDWDALNKTL